uniref:Uncharacterized protein n=1 Tax=Oryza punctata TaxID=4537 RepID=A0A0E0M130_ORYPU
MASAVVKMAVVCLLLLSVGHLMASAAAHPDNDDAAALLRLKDRIELQEEEALALAEELALLDDGAGDGAVGAGCSCNTAKCKTCIAKCVIKCFPKGPRGFPGCFFTCVFTTSKCFQFGA